LARLPHNRKTFQDAAGVWADEIQTMSTKQPLFDVESVVARTQAMA
jgi:hypothetical protein